MDTEFHLWAPLVIAVVFPVLGAFAAVVVMRTRMEGVRERLKELIEDLQKHDDESAKYRENQARNFERMNGLDTRMTRIENRQTGSRTGNVWRSARTSRNSKTSR